MFSIAHSPLAKDKRITIAVDPNHIHKKTL